MEVSAKNGCLKFEMRAAALLKYPVFAILKFTAPEIVSTYLMSKKIRSIGDMQNHFPNLIEHIPTNDNEFGELELNKEKHLISFWK